jgi:hypothetical protein
MRVMGKGRWAAVGCATLVALPFCAAGIATIFSAPRSTGQDLAVRIAAGSVFLVGGLAIILGAIVVTRSTGEAFELRRRYPDQPWMWRRDWAANAIADRGALAVGTMWVFAIFWNLISSPLLFVFPWREVRDSPVVVLPFLFPAIGVVLLIVVGYLTAQRMKFGASVCHIDHLPIVPGRAFHGELETRVREMPPAGFVLRLTCVQRVSGTKTTNETILWEETQKIALATPSYEGAHVPFTFAIPSGAEPTQNTLNRTSIVWRLSVSAEVPGVDYSATFELPVFATGEKTIVEPAWPAPDTDLSKWTPDPESHIAIALLPSGGDEITVGPATKGRLGFILFSIVWYGVIVVMFAFGVPRFFPMFFGLLGLIIVLIGVDWMLGRSVIRADRQSLSLLRTWIGFGSPHELPPRDVTAITTSIGGVQNGVPMYDVVVHCGEKRFTAAKYVQSKRDAEMVAARVRRAIGLRASVDAARSRESGTPEGALGN